MKFSVVFVVAVLAIALTANAMSDADKGFGDALSRFFRRDLKNTKFFGAISVVENWVKEARTSIRSSLQKLSQPENKHTKLKDLIGVDQEIPFHGFVFRLNPADGEMSIDEIMKTKFGAKVPPPHVVDATRELELLQEMAGVTEDSLPESFNFYESYPDCQNQPVSQEGCGCCWAFAVATATTGRTCKYVVDKKRSEPDAGWHVPKNFRLSPQQLISCKPKMTPSDPDGCKGGYVSSTMEWVTKNKMSEYQCVGFKASSSPELCDQAQTCDPLWSITGSVESLLHAPAANRVRELKMMKDLVEKGPIPVSFRVPAVFMGFDGAGVFRKGPNDPWLGTGEQHAWHAVTIVGYGKETDGTPYWLIENSWGAQYCEMGKAKSHMYKFIRGASTYGDETTCFLESTDLPSLIVTTQAPPKRAAPETAAWPEVPKRCWIMESNEACSGSVNNKMMYGFCKESCKNGAAPIARDSLWTKCLSTLNCCPVAIEANKCSAYDHDASCELPATCKARKAGETIRNKCGPGAKVCCTGALNADMALEVRSQKHPVTDAAVYQQGWITPREK